MSEPYSNVGPEVLTLDVLERAAAAVRALGPMPANEITVSPAILAVTREIVTGSRIHVDPSLPPGMWHEGPPRRSA